jgi:hypothetical protein
MGLKIFVILAIAFCVILADDPVHSCPKYKCEKGTHTSCVNVKFGLKTDGFNKISLTDICKKGEYCNVPRPRYIMLPKVDKDTAYTCEINSYKPITVRYPGEKCDKNEDCYKVDETTPTCVSGYCTGIAEGNTCKFTASCVAGLYCDKNTNTCVKQKSEGDCKESFECVNHLLCYKGKCSLFPFSLEVGAEVDKEDPHFNDLKCKFNMVFNGKCVSIVQEEAGDKDGFVECKYGETCTYKIGDGVRKEECGCGFNADGKGYCPLGVNKREDKLKVYFSKAASTFKNTCHSLQRAGCYQYEYAVEGFPADLEKFSFAHIYHNAVPCARAVLGGNFMNLSMVAIALLISLLF